MLNHAWDDDFADSRNRGIDAAECDWIVCVDADERLINASALRDQITRASKEIGGFIIERHDLVQDRETGRSMVHAVGIVRAFRKQDTIRYAGAVHERVGESVLAAGFHLEIASGCRIDHLVRAMSPLALKRKQQGYLKLLNREISRDPSDPWFRYYRAKTHWYLAHEDEALIDFKEVETSDRTDGFLRASAFSMRALLLSELERPDEAMAAVAQSLHLVSRQSLAHYTAAEVLYRRGRFADAADEYRKVRLTLGDESNVDAWHGDYYFSAEKRAYKIGCCYLALGQLDDASRVFGDGVMINPADAGCYFGMAHVTLNQGRLEDAVGYVSESIVCDPGWQEPRRLKEKIMAAIECSFAK